MDQEADVRERWKRMDRCDLPWYIECRARSEKRTFKERIGWWLTRKQRPWEHVPLNQFTDEQKRRLYDLDNPHAEYKDDDPRKYGYYNMGTSGYTPKPGEEPFIFEGWKGPIRIHPVSDRVQRELNGEN